MSADVLFRRPFDPAARDLVFGQQGSAAPEDAAGRLFVTLPPAGSISVGEAWQRHSLPARLASTPARAGLTVFMRGQLWNLGSDGRSMLALPDRHLLAPDQPGTQLVNLWL